MGLCFQILLQIQREKIILILGTFHERDEEGVEFCTVIRSPNLMSIFGPISHLCSVFVTMLRHCVYIMLSI